MSARDWSAVEARLRWERRPDGQVLRCFAERPAGLHPMLASAAAQRPDAEALVCGDRRLSWRDVEAHSAALAGAMASAGVTAGDRVAMLLGNGAAFVLVLFAAARLGAIAVPISPREQKVGVAYVIEDCGASALFYEFEFAHAVPDASSLRLVVDVDAPDFSRLLDTPAAPAAPPGEEAAAVILYTSGTTGRPKGAVLTHRGLIHSTLNYVHCMETGPGDRHLVAVPMSHVTGLVASITTAVAAQAAMIVLRSFSARRFLELAEAERITHTVLVPAMYNLCLLESSFPGRDLSAWRLGGYGGAPMPEPSIARLAEILPNLGLMNLYGATETTSPAVMMPPALAVSRRQAVGLPAPGARILIMDNDEREVPRGEVGEIWIGGTLLADGYWNNPQATASEFVGGFWRSGDLGTMDADGFVHVHDRKKDMINRGGYKIFSAEVESLLMACPGVAEAAVVGRPCDVMGERVHAVVVLAPEAPDVTTRELRGKLKATLADYKLPETWTVTRDPLPRNPNGKVLKRVLRDALAPYRHGLAVDD